MRYWTIVLAGWLLATTLTPEDLGAKPRHDNSSEMERRVAELEAANAELERRLERYRHGLERAVAELNRLRSRKLPQRVAPPPSTRPEAGATPWRRSALEVGDRLLSLPRTRMEKGRVVVSGEIANPHPELLYGTLVVELLRDGMPLGEARIPFEVPAHGRAPYSTSFELRGWAAGSYSARVGFAY